MSYTYNTTAVSVTGGMAEEVRGTYLTPVVVALVVLMTLTVAMRFFTRIHLLHSFGPDDWLIIPALMAAYATNIAAIISEQDGWGHHVMTLDPERWTSTHKLMIVTQITNTFAVALTKLSILLFFRRFCLTKYVRWGINITFVYICMWLMAFLFVILFQCTPLSSYWTSTEVAAAHCIFSIQTPLYLGHGLGNLLGDVVVLALPIPTIIKLQLPWRQKLSLLALFSLGLIVALASVLRLVSIYQVSASPFHDVSWYGYDLWVYTSIETNIGVICASIPSVKPLLVRFIPSLASWSGKGSAGLESEATLNGSRTRDTMGSRRNKPVPGLMLDDVAFVEDGRIVVERDKPFRREHPQRRVVNEV